MDGDIAIGSDHAGFLLKKAIKFFLVQDCQMRVFDAGTDSEESVDYPDFGAIVANKVATGICPKGVLICGSGIGMSIVANKFANIRAALCLDVESAILSRQHNDANILVLAGRKTSVEQALEIVKVWLQTEFVGGRHAKRLAKIGIIEQNR